MVGFAWAHARGAWRRTAAAGFAIVVAVCALVVLTGTVSTSRLAVTGTVAGNFRSTYDILVRPRGAVSAAESSSGMVRPNFLTGTYGGITQAQVAQIAGLPQVQVAAPVAVLGQVMRTVKLTVDVEQVLGDRARAMVRYSLAGSARNGTGITSTQSGYLYLTRAPLSTVNDSTSTASSPAQVEQTSTGPVTACLASDAGGRAATPGAAFAEQCWSVASSAGAPASVEALLTIPVSVQAIDPVAENALTGLDAAIVDGRALTGTDAAAATSSGGGTLDTVTAVMASHLPLDLRATLSVQELDDVTIGAVLGTDDAHRRAALVTAATPARSVASVQQDAATAYADIVTQASAAAGGDQSLITLALVRPGQVGYQTTGAATLSPTVVACDPSVWLTEAGGTDYLPTPSSVCDTGYRQVTLTPARTDLASLLSFSVVGTYDPDRIEHRSALNDVPLETYRSPVVTGADAASVATLGGKPLESDLNPAGYVQAPPALLVPISGLSMIATHVPGLDRSAPVSSVRVRVAGVTGISAADRERIRVVAEQIHQRTGLDVDITAGASLADRLVSLPATASGTPALLVNEQWTKKGVAVAIADAVDAKSVILLVLVLVSAALTIWLTATASVAARRGELGTLACLGWPPGLRRRAVATESTLLGAAAGALGLALAVAIGAGLHVHLGVGVLVGAVPAGILLGLLPGLSAAAAAGRVAPAELFRSAPRRTGHLRAVRGPGGVALGLLARRPGRIAVAAAGVALAVTAGGLLTAVLAHVHQTLVGSLLGDAVAVQVRTPDVVAAALIALLGLTALATLLFLGLNEDARSLAALRAVGWTDTMLGRIVATQALTVAVVGALVGVAVTLAVWTAAFGAPDRTTWTATLTTALVAVAVSLLTALAPATWAARLPTAHLLASE